MSAAYLGDVFDIHGGGLDLIFPHHENEIAQSRCAHGTPAMANTWMHNGFLQVEGEKMSKSLGNFVTINELLGEFHGTVLRYNMLRTHYRQPIDWRASELERARHELWAMSDIIRHMAVEDDFFNPRSELVDEKILQALADDLNTPKAFGRLHEIALESKSSRETARSFASTAAFLGLRDIHLQNRFTDSFVSSVPDEKLNIYLSAKPDILLFKNFSANSALSNAALARDRIKEKGITVRFEDKGILLSFDGASTESASEKIERLIQSRQLARARKDFKESDRIRDELAAMGVVLKDGKDADGKPVTTWEIAR
jgi:cysteinyl-tRNA synthetase